MFKSVKSMVALIYVGLVVIIILLGVISLWYMIRISKTIDGLIITNYNSIIRMNDLKETLREQDKAIYAHIRGDAGNSSEKIAELNQRFLADYYNEYATIVIPKEKQYIDNIYSDYVDYIALCDTLLNYDPNDAAESELAKMTYEKDLINQQIKVEKGIYDLHMSNEEALFERKEDAARSAKSSILLLGIIFPAAALGGYWLAKLYTNRFFSPLYDITQSIKLIREGHLDSKAYISTEDEFGMLASEFNDMTRRLREFEESTMGSLINERGKTDSLIRSINEPLLVLDRELTIIEMNEAFRTLFGITADEKNPVLDDTVFHDELLSYITRMNASSQLSPPTGETIIINKGEDDLFYHAVTTPVLGRDSESIGIIIMLHNITEMKLLEKARSDFIATISHEFKTPLTGIVIGADLMTDEAIGQINSEQREIIETIKEDSERLGVLVGEILELSKIESSKAIYDFNNCDIGQIVAVSVKQFLLQAERNGISLGSNCPSDMPQVRADFSKITWVLNNLLSNAMKYSRTGDSVIVEAKATADGVLVSVMDTGIGVPEEFVNDIFEKFIPIRKYDVEVRGSGVGLAVSKEIVNAHGGRIWCESRQSEGSKFSFTLQYAC